MLKKIIITCFCLYALLGFPAKAHGIVTDCLVEGGKYENDLYLVTFRGRLEVVEADDLSAGDGVTVFYQYGRVTSVLYGMH